MKRFGHAIPVAASLLAASFLTVTFAVPSASACSLAEPVAPWLQFVLSHGLASLNPDCTLTWKTGETTDLSGNLVTSPIDLFMQQYGIAFFVVGVALSLLGGYLFYRSRRLSRTPERANFETQPQTG